MQKRTQIGELLGELTARNPTGFATALHVKFSTPTFLFQSYPPGWLEEYTSLGLHLQDPNVIWGFTNEGAIRWSDLSEQDPAGVLTRAGNHGMTFGLAAAVLRDGSRSVGGFSRGDREFSDEEVAELLQILADLHDATFQIDGLEDGDRAALKEMSIRLTHS